MPHKIGDVYRWIGGNGPLWEVGKIYHTTQVEPHHEISTDSEDEPSVDVRIPDPDFARVPEYDLHARYIIWKARVGRCIGHGPSDGVTLQQAEAWIAARNRSINGTPEVFEIIPLRSVGQFPAGQNAFVKYEEEPADHAEV